MSQRGFNRWGLERYFNSVAVPGDGFNRKLLKRE